MSLLGYFVCTVNTYANPCRSPATQVSKPMQAGKIGTGASGLVGSSLTFPADTEDASNAMRVCRQVAP